jgi:hypothetical protein
MDFLPKLTRYETAMRNGFHPTLKQFLALQASRRAEEQRQAQVNLVPPPPDDHAPKGDSSPRSPKFFRRRDLGIRCARASER